MKTPQRIFIALIAVMVMQAVYYYPQLPHAVASHFDGSGNPNGWSSKATFFAVMFGTSVVMALLFLVLPRSFSRMPTDIVSLPNRDYWLADERRGDTIRHIETQMGWFGVATMLLLIAVQQLTIDANLGTTAGLSGTSWWVFGGYLLYSVAWTIRFVLHFTRTGDR